MDTQKALEERHEEVLDLISLILETAGVYANPKLFSAICKLDAEICEAMGLDVGKYALSDSITSA